MNFTETSHIYIAHKKLTNERIKHEFLRLDQFNIRVKPSTVTTNQRSNRNCRKIKFIQKRRTVNNVIFRIAHFIRINVSIRYMLKLFKACLP